MKGDQKNVMIFAEHAGAGRPGNPFFPPGPFALAEHRKSGCV
jgi:hypothetical protein